MGNKNAMKVNKQTNSTRLGGCQSPRTDTVQRVSKVTNSNWSKIAKKVLNENIGAWKTLAKE